jgi:hypothetical protein
MQTASGGFGYWPGAKEVHVYASAYATWVLQLAAKAGHPVPEDALAPRPRRPRGAASASSRFPDPRRLGLSRRRARRHRLARPRRRRPRRPQARRRAPHPAPAPPAVRPRLPADGPPPHDPKAPEVRAAARRAARQHPRAPRHRAHPGALTLRSRRVLHLRRPQRRDRADGPAARRARAPDRRQAGPRPARAPGSAAAGATPRRTPTPWSPSPTIARIYEAELPDFNARAWVGGANVLDVQFQGPRARPAPRPSPRWPKILRLSRDMSKVTAAPRGPPAPGPGPPLLPPRRRVGPRAGRPARARAGLHGHPHAAHPPRARPPPASPPASRSPWTSPCAPMSASATSPSTSRSPPASRASRARSARAAAPPCSRGRGWWVSHEEQRPDRVVVFADDLPPGTHHHTIDLRSTSRGRFSFPPALAEAMYMPEVHGRTVGAALEVR